jgi:hypothetical protein
LMPGMNGMPMKARLSTLIMSRTWMSVLGEDFIGSTWYERV